MAKEQKNKGWINRLRQKTRLVGMDPESFKEKWSLAISPLAIVWLILFFFMVVVAMTYLVIANTPIKNYLVNEQEIDRKDAMENNLKMQELEDELRQKDQYIKNLKDILSGDFRRDTTRQQFDSAQSVVNPDSIDFSRSKEDSLLRDKIEDQDRFSVYDNNLSSNSKTMEGVFFFTPVNGEISQSFYPDKGHFGADIVAEKNSPVNATLDGTVVFSTWTSDAGHEIHIQHNNNLISVYKHNAVLLKKVGERVKAGEPIAILGNSGELTTGVHLHFELWQAGKPLDPQLFMTF